jgi:Preprotein translocase subunit SecY
MTKIVYKDENLWMRVLITLAIVFCARMLYFFPVPGVDLKALFGLYQRHIHTQGGRLVGFDPIAACGAAAHISICALGIMPFINACIIVQIIGFLVPGVNGFSFMKETAGSK